MFRYQYIIYIFKKTNAIINHKKHTIDEKV